MSRSDDGSAHMVRARFPWVRLVENRENVGFARRLAWLERFPQRQRHLTLAGYYLRLLRAFPEL